MSWVTHSEELVESIAIGESSVYEVDAYWVLRQDIQEMINRAEAIKVSGVRAQWVLEDAIEHLYGAKDALFNTAVFSRTPSKAKERITEIREHVNAMSEILESLEERNIAEKQ